MSGPEKEQRSGKIAPARPVILLIAAKGKMAAIALDDCPDGQKVLHLFQPQTRLGAPRQNGLGPRPTAGNTRVAPSIWPHEAARGPSVERNAVVFGLFKSRRNEQAAYGLYGALVAQARQPTFYTDYGVDDSVDGRFDMIALLAALVIRRLQSADAQGPKVAQALFDLMFADMDRNLREMGVSDLAVGKHIKRMAKAFYGRAEAYEEGLAKGVEILEAALARNLYRNTEPAPWQVAAVAAYVVQAVTWLDEIPHAELLAGKITFPSLQRAPTRTEKADERIAHSPWR
jgi:cytochrome b pre-mRNA-processing protein 3